MKHAIIEIVKMVAIVGGLGWLLGKLPIHPTIRNMGYLLLALVALLWALGVIERL